MFEYFPGNYVWNLGVVATLNAGGTIDEVDRACRPLKDLASQGSDVGTADFMTAWRNVADQLEAQADEALKAGHLRTAGQKYFRASVYVSQAERMQSAKDPGRNAEYERSVELLVQVLRAHRPRDHARSRSRSATPTLPAYFHDASTDGAPAPVMIVWNGLDSTKEMMVGCGIHHELAARGISTLMVDCPGSGEALRLHGLTAQIDTEVWAAACVDWLEDPRRRAHRPHRSRRLVPRRLLRPAGRRLREAARTVRRLGRQPRLGGGAEAAARPRGREPRSPLLGPRALGVGTARHRHVHRVRRGRQPRRRRRADHGAVPHRARARTTGRSRSSTPTVPTTRPSTARSASSGSSRPRREPPSTSGSTTSRTSSATSPTG